MKKYYVFESEDNQVFSNQYELWYHDKEDDIWEPLMIKPWDDDWRPVSNFGHNKLSCRPYAKASKLELNKKRRALKQSEKELLFLLKL